MRNGRESNPCSRPNLLRSPWSGENPPTGLAVFGSVAFDAGAVCARSTVRFETSKAPWSRVQEVLSSSTATLALTSSSAADSTKSILTAFPGSSSI